MRRTVSRLSGAGTLALLIGILALTVPPHPFGVAPTWESLLAPYSTGAPLVGGFRVEDIARGPDNAVVVSVRRPADGAAVEVLIVERGRWASVHASRSFTIDYEIPRSPAVERDEVTAVLAATIRSRDDGLPAPDAVALRTDDPTVLPWWIEVVRGLRGTLIGASIVVLAVSIVAPSAGPAYLGLVLGAIDVAARIVGLPTLRPDVSVAWMLPFAGVLLFSVLRGRGAGWPSHLRQASVATAIALVLRLALGPWGPLHVNGHGARFVAGVARDPADIAAYGPGYHEIFAPIVALAPSMPDSAIFACNAVLAALLVPLAFAMARLVGLPARGAFLVALLLAVDPIWIRMGATEAYFVAVGFLCAAASTAMLAGLRALDGGDRRRTVAFLLAAGAMLAAAVRIHPCGWIAAATVPFVIFAGAGASVRRRMLVTAAAAAIAGGLVLCTSGSTVLDVLGNIRAGTVFRPAAPALWPVAVIVVAGAIYAVVAPHGRLALPAGACLAAMLLTRHAFDASWIWEQAYFRLYLTLPLVAAVACIPPRWFARRAVVVSATAVLVFAWLAFGWPVVVGRTTEHLEYRWVRARLQELPSECRVVHLASAGKRVLALPTYVGDRRPAVAIDLRRRSTVEAAFAPAACLYYVHSSLCSTADGRPECEAIERRLALVPVARTSFAAAREPETFGPDRDIVETVIARVERVDPDRH